jgi:hypothetical protein
VLLNDYHASFRNLIEIQTSWLLIATHVRGFFFLTKFTFFPLINFLNCSTLRAKISS